MVKLIDNKENTYSPCDVCNGKLNEFYESASESIKSNKIFFRYFFKNPKFIVGIHGFEKAHLKGIDMFNEEEIRIATSGKLIENQTGKVRGEIKFILSTVRNGEPMHYIFLRTSKEPYPVLINIYNPTEGMDFKWSSDGEKRIYLNSFRSCCPHPQDSIENFNKKHHGVNHKKYDYQLNN
jgi:hypothetical protein